MPTESPNRREKIMQRMQQRPQNRGRNLPGSRRIRLVLPMNHEGIFAYTHVRFYACAHSRKCIFASLTPFARFFVILCRFFHLPSHAKGVTVFLTKWSSLGPLLFHRPSEALHRMVFRAKRSSFCLLKGADLIHDSQQRARKYLIT